VVEESQRARPCCKDGVLSERIKIFLQLLERACVFSAIYIYTQSLLRIIYLYKSLHTERNLRINKETDV
jgi:hypothetical protein